MECFLLCRHQQEVSFILSYSSAGAFGSRTHVRIGICALLVHVRIGIVYLSCACESFSSAIPSVQSTVAQVVGSIVSAGSQLSYQQQHLQLVTLVRSIILDLYYIHRNLRASTKIDHQLIGRDIEPALKCYLNDLWINLTDKSYSRDNRLNVCERSYLSYVLVPRCRLSECLIMRTSNKLLGVFIPWYHYVSWVQNDVNQFGLYL